MFFYFIISTNNRSHLKKKGDEEKERNHNKQAKEISPPIQYHYTSVRKLIIRVLKSQALTALTQQLK